MSQGLLTSAPTGWKEKIFACGPTGMLKAVAKIAEEFNVPAELSMDEQMCCGVGVCLTCVIPVKIGDSWEYRRKNLLALRRLYSLNLDLLAYHFSEELAQILL